MSYVAHTTCIASSTMLFMRWLPTIIVIKYFDMHLPHLHCICAYTRVRYRSHLVRKLRCTNTDTIMCLYILWWFYGVISVMNVHYVSYIDSTYANETNYSSSDIRLHCRRISFGIRIRTQTISLLFIVWQFTCRLFGVHSFVMQFTLQCVALYLISSSSIFLYNTLAMIQNMAAHSRYDPTENYRMFRLHFVKRSVFAYFLATFNVVPTEMARFFLPSNRIGLWRDAFDSRYHYICSYQKRQRNIK